MLSESITSKVLKFSYCLYCSVTGRLARCFHVLIPIKMLVLKWTPRSLLTFTRLYPKIIDMIPSLAPPPPKKKEKERLKKKLIMTAKRKSNRSFVTLFTFSSFHRRHFSPLQLPNCVPYLLLRDVYPSNEQTLSERHQYQLHCACLVYMQNYKRVQSLVCHCRPRYNVFCSQLIK